MNDKLNRRDLLKLAGMGVVRDVGPSGARFRSQESSNTLECGRTAPVSLQAYTEVFLRQCQSKRVLKHEVVRAAMSEYVLPETSIQTLGLVASSRRC